MRHWVVAMMGIPISSPPLLSFFPHSCVLPVISNWKFSSLFPMRTGSPPCPITKLIKLKYFLQKNLDYKNNHNNKLNHQTVLSNISKSTKKKNQKELQASHCFIFCLGEMRFSWIEILVFFNNIFVPLRTSYLKVFSNYSFFLLFIHRAYYGETPWQSKPLGKIVISIISPFEQWSFAWISFRKKRPCALSIHNHL